VILSALIETKLLSGRVLTCGDNRATPHANVSVTVYEATAQQPTIVDTTTTGDDGSLDLEMKI